MADAPYLILNLHRDLTAWKARDPRGAKAGLRKVDLHTEYLGGRSVVLARDGQIEEHSYRLSRRNGKARHAAYLRRQLVFRLRG